MISVSEALDHIFSLANPTEIEQVRLEEAAGRVLAKDVAATRNQPPFDASAMDGYAVRAVDLQVGNSLTIIGESPAGGRFAGVVGPMQAVRIFTGAPVPSGADCILIQEDATREGDRITVGENRDSAVYIRAAGSDFKVGDILPAPRRLGAADIALLAAMNCPTIPVHRKPLVALVATGDELVLPGEIPTENQIISSNNYALKAMVEAQGAAAMMLPIARDTVESLTAVLRTAQSADLIVTLGGASVGDYDLVQNVAQEMGLELGFYKVAMRPGKPLMAGKMNDTPMIGLPGNPVSAIVCGHVFLRPMLDAMLGLGAHPLKTSETVLTCDISQNGPRAHYMRATLTDRGICPAERQDSSLLSVLGKADALLVRPENDPPRRAGQAVEYLKL